MRLKNKNKKELLAKRKLNAFFFVLFTLCLLIPLSYLTKTSPTLTAAMPSASKSLIPNDSLFRPLKKSDAKILNLDATNALSAMIIPETGEEKILFDKNSNNVNPIASMSKLMTAIIALEYYGQDKEIKLTATDARAIAFTGGNLKTNEIVTVKDLLNIMLIESNNAAADTLAKQMLPGKFITLMNQKAKDLGLKDAVFYNPSGLTENETEMNKASAADLGKIVTYLIKNQPLIPQICSTKSIDYSINGIFFKKLENTNILLQKDSDYLWGKTGYTKEANGCIILVSKKPFFSPFERKTAYIVNIIMGADGKYDRFVEAEKLQNWITDSYIW